MFQQGLGEQAVTPSCAGVRCVPVGCGHHVQHCRAALVSVSGGRGVPSQSGSFAHASVSAALFFVSRALVSLSLSVTSKKRREG